MKKQLASMVIIAAMAVSGQAMSSDKGGNVPAEAQKFQQFLGHWRGDAEITETGKAPVPMKMKIDCQQASSGFAVLCHDTISNQLMTMTETDLMGFNPADGSYHWYAVTNTGETHDHLVEWISDNAFVARTTWQQGGVEMAESIAVTWSSPTAMEFRTVITAAGQEAMVFVGNLKK
ncbi:MAG: hypothetical protein OEZ47_10645 [Gammaproteobacteria bacterium]|nr:hypothetical protein [Gammaproteobacteria bacterium]